MNYRPSDPYTNFGASVLAGGAADATYVNGVLLSPAATGSAVQVAAVGDDTNISINLVPKGSGTIGLPGAGGGTTAALIMGAGTSASPATTATADKNFLGFWTQSTATTGDSRGLYLRHYFSGAGGSGEAARLYGTINNVSVATGGTVNGAHISLSATGASAAVSGAANVARMTLDLAATVGVLGGTVNVLRLDTNIPAGPTIPARTAFITTDNLAAQKLDYLLNVTNASTAMFAAATDTTISHKLKITVAGTDYFVALTAAV